MEYKFTSDFVNLIDLLDGQEGVTHIRGTECDLRVQSNRETTHYIKSPNVRASRFYMYQDVAIWVSECLSSQYNLHLCDRRPSRRAALGKGDFEVWIHSRHQFWGDWNDCVSFSFDKFSGLVSFQALFPRRYHLSKCVGWRCHNWV